MGGGLKGGVSGVILGLAVVLLFQQLAYVDLGLLVPGVVYLVIGGLVGGVVFGLTGRRLERRARAGRPAVQPWESEAGDADEKPPADEPK